MVQLSNDCFAFGKDMISLDDAHELLRNKLSPVVGMETVSIYDAVGRVICNDITASISVPPSNNSAVDGYAIKHSNLTDNNSLTMVGRITAGASELDFCNSGTVRIFTGASIPSGFDTVYMQEDVIVDGDKITFPDGQKQGANIRKKGEDITAGELVFKQGRKLKPQDIGLLAGQGLDKIAVYKKLKVGFFSSGDELVEVGTDNNTLRQGILFDSNRPMVISLIKSLGFDAIDLGRAEDNLESTKQILKKGCDLCDVVLSAGGMSVGEEDHIQAVLKQHAMDFWKVAIKPGKPVGFGMVDGTPFMGFPGNPVSVFVVFGIMGILVLKQLSGEVGYELPRIPVKLGFDVKAKLGRREFNRVVLQNNNGQLVAIKSGSQGSGVLSSVSSATGMVEILENCEKLAVGDTVNYIPFEGLYS